MVLPDQFGVAAQVLLERYPANATVKVLARGELMAVLLHQLPDEAEAWLLPALPTGDDRTSAEALRRVMDRLFGPDGCPWDREQTHDTLRPYFLEECYELIDAIDRGDVAGMREELGDVLAHVFMQAAVATYAGEFTLEDVAAHAAGKFVRRHPHVFGDEESGSPEALLDRWESIKREERADASDGQDDLPLPGTLDSVPRAAPALQRASQLLGRARRAGLRDPSLSARQLARNAVDSLGESPGEREVGAALLALVHLAREAGVDAEQALRLVAGSFAEGFGVIERRSVVERTDLSQQLGADGVAAWEAAFGGAHS